MRGNHRRAALVATPVVFGVFVLWTIQVGGQPPQPAQKNVDVAGEPSLADVGRCILCHGSSPEELNDAFPEAHELILGNESRTWNKLDMHRKAYASLESELGQQMTKILRQAWDVKNPNWKVQDEAKCLTCHALDKKPKEANKSLADYDCRFGVSCEVCHGFASKWDTPHSNKKWREESPKDKAKVGELDMRDPNERAKKCSACHVGNLAEGKFVTHEMYAAGHPPLPPFEVASFSRDQKMHRNEKDVVYFGKLSDSDSWRLFHYRKGESQVARQLAVGAIVTLQSAMQLLVDELKRGEVGKSDHSLDFAHFDCYACHHDLKYQSERQKRRFECAPGRPQIRSGGFALTRIVAQHAAENLKLDLKLDGKDFTTLLKELEDVFRQRPFGQTGEVHGKATKLIDWADKAITELSQDKLLYSPDQTRNLMLLIMEEVGSSKTEWLDPDSAQQLIWAAETLRNEVEGGKTGPIAERWNTLEQKSAKSPVCPRLVRTNYENENLLADQLKDRFRFINDFRLDPLREMFLQLSAVAKGEAPK
ncbi:MAG TPA: multiheme c-type cytochrome [Gemmataceae bacterium]|nr:multiheme c-type cytochrome [Gemmataceae bacterium]